MKREAVREAMKNVKEGREAHTLARYYMTRAVPIVQATERVSAVRERIHKSIKNFVSVDYLYVIDSHGIFTGVLSYRALLSAKVSDRIADVCTTTPLYTIAPSASADDAAHVSLHHDVESVAVIDEQRKLLGVIPSASIVKILHQRRIESLFHRSGVASESRFDKVLETPVLRAVRHRMLWLFLGLIGGLLAAEIIGSFEETLGKNLLLAAFIPLVVYIADAARTQLEAFAIRDIVIIRHISYLRYFLRQLAIVLILSVILGALSFGISYSMYSNPEISAVIALAIVGASISSVVTGVLIPFMFQKFSTDPANASGPIGTILQDLLSVSIYFSIAAWLL